MAYSELIKNFNKIRDYMRDFYVYGFKRSAVMLLTANLQNSSTPSRRTSKRVAPIQDSDCVGSTLGHEV